MSEAKFQKVASTDKPLYGPKKLLLCGFSPDAQAKFMTLLELIGLADVSKVWVTREQAGQRLSELLQLPDNAGQGAVSDLPRAIIVAGITQQQMHWLMVARRQSGMQPPLWAVLTPTSESWTLQSLLAELAAEHRALQKRK